MFESQKFVKGPSHYRLMLEYKIGTLPQKIVIIGVCPPKPNANHSWNPLREYVSYRIASTHSTDLFHTLNHSSPFKVLMHSSFQSVDHVVHRSIYRSNPCRRLNAFIIFLHSIRFGLCSNHFKVKVQALGVASSSKVPNRENSKVVS